MTNKERCVKAIYELIKSQEEGTWLPKKCPLCKIFFKKRIAQCKGCPVANKQGKPGCIGYTSYWIRDFAKLRKEDNYYEYGSMARAMFWEKNLPEIITWPESQFTKEGWEYRYLPDVINPKEKLINALNWRPR